MKNLELELKEMIDSLKNQLEQKTQAKEASDQDVNRLSLKESELKRQIVQLTSQFEQETLEKEAVVNRLRAIELNEVNSLN